MWNPFHPPPAPPAFGQGKVVPQDSANLLSKLVFSWLNPFLNVGYSRPLEKEDLWELPEYNRTDNLTNRLEQYFYMRVEPSKRPPQFLSNNHDLSPSTSASDEEKTDRDIHPNKDTANKDTDDPKVETSTKKAGSGKKQVYDGSLVKAINASFFWRIWPPGIMYLISALLSTTTPLISKALLTWLEESYYWHRVTPAEAAEIGLKKPQSMGHGIGLAIGLFAMQMGSSFFMNHYQIEMLANGMAIRAAVIGSIFRKSLRLSTRARVEGGHSAGQITTMISTDATRLDRVSAYFHLLWVSPIQIAVGIGLLIANLGVSGLVGLGVLILGFPLQGLLIRVMFKQRRKGVKITDQRQRETGEALQGIRLLKYYAWEGFYAQQIGILRAREVATIRKSAVARATAIASFTFIPILASILSFITYALTGHNLNVAIIFSSLQYLNIIRAPLIFLPLVFAASADAMVALGRIGKFLEAEEMNEPYSLDLDPGRKTAVVVDGDFTWEKGGKAALTSKDAKGKGKDKDKGKGKGKGKGKDDAADRKETKPEAKKSGFFGRSKKKETVLPTTSETTAGESAGAGTGARTPEEEEQPFEFKNLRLEVPKGSFVAIVGKVGSGKSSLLQAMVGEMRRTRGSVTFGGAVAWVPQTPWIQNLTLRENIVFGQEDNEERFREVIKACCLERDIEMLPQGQMTEIGERGINLSGGQKARVSLARAAYSEADVVLLDDSLSAVDAYVGKAILENCLLKGPLSDRTRIMATHSLHVLDKTDYIYVMENGLLTEQGTYEELMADSVVFSRLMEEYGSLEKASEAVNPEDAAKLEAKPTDAHEKQDDNKAREALMTEEERNTGAVSLETYTKYLKFAGGLIWAPTLLILLTLTQCAQVANNLFLGYWTGDSIHGFKQGDYMAVYASLGAAQAIFSFLLSFSFALATLAASLNLFKAALQTVMRSPTSFFDTTPMGRIMSRLSKDQDTLDTQIAMTANQFLSTFSNVLGTVALVFYTFPYLGILFVPLTFCYLYVASYYRRTSVETKRLDSILRSALYGSYQETLTGLPTVRAYGVQQRAIKSAEDGLDGENKAYFMTNSIQEWLGIRVDFFGNLLVLGIALFACGFRTSVSPSKIGVVLSYTLSITQIFSQMIQQYATNEQNMNAVERMLVYTELPSEAALETPNDPPPSWPEKGEIVFNDVQMAYREGLPLVLKGVSFSVQPGEKIGIVGRTGAGKSSLLQALFRMVELQDGSITIDGHNIRDMGLNAIRSRLALVPQDSTLFLGSLRNNLDPQRTRTDAELISALQRAWLLPKGESNTVTDAKFGLDANISDEGSNYSAGEKQLLALCRALVKNSRIIILDEATSSVDVETDAKVQRTIQTEFASSTLLCIAHRLNTIAYYDRILVMDAGKVAEFDTVLNLFDREDSIFRSLCDEAGLSRQDILRIREQSSHS